MSKTTVINKKNAPEGWHENPDYVYIGRKVRRSNPPVPDTKWGNPFKVRNESERASSIEQYREYILNKPELLASLDELRGKTLVCWCKPLACHGDVLIELLEDN